MRRRIIAISQMLPSFFKSPVQKTASASLDLWREARRRGRGRGRLFSPSPSPLGHSTAIFPPPRIWQTDANSKKNLPLTQKRTCSMRAPPRRKCVQQGGTEYRAFLPLPVNNRTFLKRGKSSKYLLPPSLPQRRSEIKTGRAEKRGRRGCEKASSSSFSSAPLLRRGPSLPFPSLPSLYYLLDSLPPAIYGTRGLANQINHLRRRRRGREAKARNGKRWW